MLRETDHIKVYPNKSVIEDLVTRTGPATEDSFSPFKGKKEFIESQFSGSQKSKFRINDFLEHNKNRDLEPARINVSNTYDMLVEKTSESLGLRTLEDLVVDGVESSAVEEYLTMLCVGFKKDNTSPYRVNAEKYTLTYKNTDGDDDSETEEKYVLTRVDEDYVSNMDYEDIIKELPHVIKSIWSLSKFYQANLFSFLFAYWDIIQTKHKNVTITDFMYYPTYLIGKDGSFKRRFDHGRDNKYTIYPAVTKIFITPESYKEEYNLCMKFMNMLIALGIDYRDEDPLTYNNEFVNSLVCTYLLTNDEYFKSYKNIDAEIIMALSPENILSVTKSHMYSNINRYTEVYDYNQSLYFITERLRIAHKVDSYEEGLLEEDIESAMDILMQVLSLRNGVEVSIPRNLINFEGNGLLYMSKDVLQVPGKYFGTFKNSLDYNVAITSYGFVIALEESFDDLYYLSKEDCLKALEEYRLNGDIQKEANWKSL